MIPVSPFLHREQPAHRFKWKQRAETYGERLIPTPEQQRGLIEKYRYRWYVRTDSLGRFMQALGDWGRKYFPFIGTGGWNGLGGQGLGGPR